MPHLLGPIPNTLVVANHAFSMQYISQDTSISEGCYGYLSNGRSTWVTLLARIIKDEQGTQLDAKIVADSFGNLLPKVNAFAPSCCLTKISPITNILQKETLLVVTMVMLIYSWKLESIASARIMITGCDAKVSNFFKGLIYIKK